MRLFRYHAHHDEVIFSASRLSICEQEELDATISNSKAESLIVERGALDACNEREDLDLHAALLTSQAHHNEVIFCVSRLSIVNRRN